MFFFLLLLFFLRVLPGRPAVTERRGLSYRPAEPLCDAHSFRVEPRTGDVHAGGVGPRLGSHAGAALAGLL